MDKQTLSIIMAVAVIVIIMSIVYLLKESPEGSPLENPENPVGSSNSLYRFHPNVESSAFDITHYPDLKGNVSEITKKCNDHPNCIAFNSEGWIKYRVKNKNKWDKKPEWEGKDSGLYVHKNPSSKYTFYPHVSSSGYDIEHVKSLKGDNTALSKLCDENPDCMGFTSGGWLKSAILSKNSWNFDPPWITDENSGLYIKNSYFQ